jgi:hypothetical protein
VRLCDTVGGGKIDFDVVGIKRSTEALKDKEAGRKKLAALGGLDRRILLGDENDAGNINPKTQPEKACHAAGRNIESDNS